jgi:hypothetical protein
MAYDFAERQELSRAGRHAVRDRLDDRRAQSPELSAGDVAAAWDPADSGEETVSGAAPTPDQAVVDEIAAAAGLTYADDEPLNYGKVSERDAQHWELNPASNDDSDDMSEEDEEEPAEEVEDDTDVLDLIDDDDEDDDAEDEVEDDANADDLDFLDDEEGD